MSSPVRHARFGAAWCCAAAAVAAALSGCGGGGGGSGQYSSHGKLLAVTFPDPSQVNATPTDTPPIAAPLLQQVVLTFDSSPDPNGISSNTIQIRDSSGFPVPGGFAVDGMTVTFTPQLPTNPVTILANGAIDTGGTGLQPGQAYTIRTGPAIYNFISGIDPQLTSRFADANSPGGILIGFVTGTDPTIFLAGVPLTAPQLVSVDPLDGSTGVSPNLYTDPGHLFPPRRSFQITFDSAVSPDLGNVSDATFQLIDLDDRPAAFPAGLPLGIDVVVVSNDLGQSVVEVTSSGILPFGHQLALEYPSDLHGVSQTGALSGVTTIASTFTIASSPSNSINDTLFENFDTNTRQETDPTQLGVGTLGADWNAQSSGILQASFAFQGDGLLGRFQPPPPASGDTHVIALDTSTQQFPLPDGSTPDAPVYTVTGGVFAFTDVDIPAGVVIQPVGNNPLVITATGSFRLAGTIYVGGQDGTPDNAYDSATTSVPGGAATCGGGRGGEGQPIIFFPPDQVSYANLVSPPYGGQGYGMDPVDGVMKRIGGIGGQCGMIDHPDNAGNYSTNEELNCSPLRGDNPGVKVPGGGGGSMYLLGRQAGDTDGGYAGNLRNGIGNVLPDGQGNYNVRPISQKTLNCGTPGQPPFYDDGNSQNDFYGSRGQLTRLIGGQGGGSGASNVEAYYCGIWCKRDSDPKNDACCTDWLGSKGKYGDSVTDARGGGGGGGGGAVLIQALGDLTLDPTALIDAHGGAGLGGEAIGCSNFGGGGAGAAGGMVILQSGTSVTVNSGAKIDVREGAGDRASVGDTYLACDQSGAAGDGGHGSPGFIQLQVPAGSTATVVDQVGSFPRRNTKYDPPPWIDQSNTLNPVEFTPISVAISTWYDMGRVITRVPGSTPAFTFGGLDPNGFVVTDANGNVVDPAGTNVECDYLGQIDPITRQYRPGQEPRSNFIPLNASVKVEFQGANAVAEGSKEVDPSTITLWSPTAAAADGMQFIRWRITFNLTAAPGSVLSPESPRPTVQSITIPTNF